MKALFVAAAMIEGTEQESLHQYQPVEKDSSRTIIHPSLRAMRPDR